METTRRRAAVRPLLYERVAADVADLVARGTYRPGDRVPSVRELSRRLRVSVNTVLEAYAQLENQRIIEARPQSGYYVSCPLPEPEGAPAGAGRTQKLAARTVELGRGPLDVMRSLSDPSLVPLGRGAPNPELLPIEKLSRMLATEARRFRLDGVSY